MEGENMTPIDLFYMPDEKNKLNKTLNNHLRILGNFRQECSIINPTVLIELPTDDELPKPTDYNYMYIPAWGRYYFITDVVMVNRDLWRISGKVDVLMSFKEGINTCPIILANTETTNTERYMMGDIWKTLVKSKTDIVSFPSGLNPTGEYILITSGG